MQKHIAFLEKAENSSTSTEQAGQETVIKTAGQRENNFLGRIIFLGGGGRYPTEMMIKGKVQGPALRGHFVN